MGATFDAHKLLDTILSGKPPDSEDLDRLLQFKVEEGLYIDYKSSRLLNTKSLDDAKFMLRKNVSAFANSEGGILLVGIEEENKFPIQVSGLPEGQGPEDLFSWTGRVLTENLGPLVPPPRFSVILHQTGRVLLIAVARSYSLVPMYKSGKTTYYLRLGDQTLEVPIYLMQDLILGRRRHPSLEIFVHESARNTKVGRTDNSNGWPSISINFRVRNTSLVWGKSLSAGVIGFMSGIPDINVNEYQHILENICIVRPVDSSLGLKHAEIKLSSERNLAPFQFLTASPSQFVISHLNLEEATWNGAAYVISMDSPPEWFQVTVKLKQLDHYYGLQEVACHRVEPGRLPIVSFSEGG